SGRGFSYGGTHTGPKWWTMCIPPPGAGGCLLGALNQADTHPQAHMPTHIEKHTHTHPQAHMPTHIETHTHIHRHTHTHTHMHTDTHTHRDTFMVAGRNTGGDQLGTGGRVGALTAHQNTQ